MVAPRPPPRIARSPPPSSSSSPPPPSTSATPAQPMGKIVRLRREGSTTATTTNTGHNNASTSSAAPSAARAGVSTIRTIPTSAGGRQPIRRPSPSPPPDAAASTLEGSNSAAAAPSGEPSSRSGFALRRDGPPASQQPQAAARPGWKRRRPVAVEAAPVAAAASGGQKETPEAKRLQANRGEKTESRTGGVIPKSAPQASSSAAAVVEASAAASASAAVEEQPITVTASASGGGEGKAVPPSAAVPRRDMDCDSTDLTIPLPGESDPNTTTDQQGSKAPALPSAVSDVGGKPVVGENPKPQETTIAMDLDPVQQSKGKGIADAAEQTTASAGSGSDNNQVAELDGEDAESSAFVAMIVKSSEMLRSSSLWIGEALQSIRDDISKAAASDVGRARLGEMLRMSITDLFEPAAERTRAIGEAADSFAEGVERYSAEGEGKSDMAVQS